MELIKCKKKEDDEYSILGRCWHCGKFTYLDCTNVPPICKRCAESSRKVWDSKVNKLFIHHI